MSERAWHNVWPESILLSGGYTYLTIITKCHTGFMFLSSPLSYNISSEEMYIPQDTCFAKDLDKMFSLSCHI